ncbi:MAG: hypothetical protein ACFFCQ_01920 [Promethearchaeota archaeon]
MQIEVIPEQAEIGKDTILIQGDDYYLTSLDNVISYPIKSKDKQIGLMIVGKVQFAYDLVAHSKSGALGESLIQELDSILIMGKQAIRLLKENQFLVLPESGLQDEQFLNAKQKLENLNDWSVLRKIHFDNILYEVNKFNFTSLIPRQSKNGHRKLYTVWDQARLLLKEEEGVLIKYKDQLFVRLGWNGQIEAIKGQSHFSFRGPRFFDFHIGHDIFDFGRMCGLSCCF